MGFKLHSFSHGLKRARKERHLTQQQFADEFLVSVETVRNWEQGRSGPDLETLLQLFEFFDCSADYLLGRIDFRTHDLQFIFDHTGLDEQSISRLEKTKGHAPTMLVLNYLLHDFSVLDKIVGYYASAFMKERKEKTFLRIGCDPKRSDPRLFSADVYDVIPASKTDFYETYSKTAHTVKLMVFELLKRSTTHEEHMQWCQLFYDCVHKYHSTETDPQLSANAEFLAFLGFRDLMERADVNLDDFIIKPSSGKEES